MTAVLNGRYTGYVPRREGDGPGFVGTMRLVRDVELETARDAARKALAFARRVRLEGLDPGWHASELRRAASWRQRYARLRGVPCSPCNQECNQGRSCPARRSA